MAKCYYSSFLGTANQLKSIIIFFLACLNYVTSNSHCVGTCYSGGLLPKYKDMVQGKHLKGFSYKNITTDNEAKCYHRCAQDCRCRACQFKDARCELLDEDKNSKNLTDEPGYVYIDLNQTMYQGKQSHMVPQGSGCYNGCCRSQPCMNGGTCEEKCQTPKEKFTCTCQKEYKGRTCEKRVSSCMDVMIASQKAPENGVYTILHEGNKRILKIYCAFNGSRVWTLIESFSRANTEFNQKPFTRDSGANIHNPTNWSRYRMGSNRMNYFRKRSTLFRATCNFPTRDSLTPDLLIGRLSDVDIIEENDIEECRKYMFIDIMGHTCTDCRAHTAVGTSKSYHFHLDVSGLSCSNPLQFKSGDMHSSTDLFGFYGTFDDKFTCTATENSTTQWWLGQEK